MMRIFCEECGEELKITKSDVDYDLYVTPCKRCCEENYDDGKRDGEKK